MWAPIPPCYLAEQDADLVVVEFSANDSPAFYTSSARHSYEELLRKLLDPLPDLTSEGSDGNGSSSSGGGSGSVWHQPAVVLLHHYPWFKATGDGADRGLYYREPEHQLTMYSYVRPAWLQQAQQAQQAPQGEGTAGAGAGRQWSAGRLPG
jgi:hypothetical protein